MLGDCGLIGQWTVYVKQHIHSPVVHAEPKELAEKFSTRKKLKESNQEKLRRFVCFNLLEMAGPMVPADP